MIYYELDRIGNKHQGLINEFKNFLITPHDSFFCALEKLNNLYQRLIVATGEKSDSKYSMKWRKQQLEKLITAVKEIDPAELKQMSVFQICEQKKIEYYNVPESAYKPRMLNS